MGMFEQLGRQRQQPTNPQQMVQEIKADPVNFLKGKGYNVPANMTDPRSITNYLLQSGQVGGQRMQMAQQMLSRLIGVK